MVVFTPRVPGTGDQMPARAARGQLRQSATSGGSEDGRANPGASSHQFLWLPPPTSGRGTEDVKKGKCYSRERVRVEVSTPPRASREERGHAVLPSGAGGDVECPIIHQCPENSRTHSVVHRAAG